MKKFFMTTSISVLVLTLLLISGCGGEKGTSTGTGSSGGGMNLLTYLPDSASGVFTLNFTEVAKLELFDKMIKDAEAKADTEPGKAFKNYQDFVDKTGIDPKKDIHGVAVAILGTLGAEEPDAVVVINLNYDKNKITAILKQEKVEFTEEMYKDIAILSVKEDSDQNVFAFVSDSVVAAGKIDGVKKVIDLSKGEGQSVMANARLKPYIEKFSGMISFVIEFPEDAKKVHQSPMGGAIDLTRAEVVLGEFNFSGSAYTGEISLICANEEGNNQLVTTLNGFKGVAGMMGPEAAEIASKIELTASADKVTLSFDIPQELLEKFQKKMEEKTKGMMPTETDPGE